MLKTLDSLELAANVELLGDVEEVLDTGVSIIITAKNLDSLVGPSASVSSRFRARRTRESCQAYLSGR